MKLAKKRDGHVSSLSLPADVSSLSLPADVSSLSLPADVSARIERLRRDGEGIAPVSKHLLRLPLFRPVEAVAPEPPRKAPSARVEERTAERIERIACLELPAWSLQVLFHEHPAWRNAAVVVIDEDKPTAEVRAMNARARAQGVRVGMRLSVARGLVPDVHSGIVTKSDCDRLADEIADALRVFTPRVERDMSTSARFYLDPNGLTNVYGDLGAWASSVDKYLRGRGLRGTLVVGFHRDRTAAIARVAKGIVVLPDETLERARIDDVRIDRLDLPIDVRDALLELEVRTLGELFTLSRDGLATRFGEAVGRLHDLSSEQPVLPVQARPFVAPVRIELEVEPPDGDRERLLRSIEGPLPSMIESLAHQGESLAALRIELLAESTNTRDQAARDPALRTLTLRIETAEPTRDTRLVLDLVRLRIDETTLSSRIEMIALEAEGVRSTTEQLGLFGAANDGGVRPSDKRDHRAASRGLARVRAAFGEHAVVRARLRDGHLPEAQFTWEPTLEVKAAPRPKKVDESQTSLDFELPLVRRLFRKPKPLAASPMSTVEELEVAPYGRVRHHHGPWRVTGGWWSHGVARDYYYVETDRGALLWVFYDGKRHRWMLHGLVD